MKLKVIKVGGAHLANSDYCNRLISYLKAKLEPNNHIILVHGGGSEIGELHKSLNIPFEKIDGLRITNGKSINLVAMMLCGLVNKRLVAQLNHQKVKSLGISGVDCAMMTSSLVNESTWGRVGHEPQVNKLLLETILEKNILPVVAPVCVAPDGGMVNVNADTVAQAIAKSFQADSLDLVTDVDGVKDKYEVIQALTIAQAQQTIDSGIAVGGMIPKLEASISVIQAGVRSVRIGSIESLSTDTATHLSDH